MAQDLRLGGIATQFRCFADMIDAGLISDAAFVVIPVEGTSFKGFTIAPKDPEALIADLKELAGWIGQTEKHAAIEKARLALTA